MESDILAKEKDFCRKKCEFCVEKNIHFSYFFNLFTNYLYYMSI